MSGYEAETLARQLAQLGRDLDTEVTVLADLEHEAVTAEGDYRRLADLHEDAVARAFLTAPGSVDARRAQARLDCTASREASGAAWKRWQDAKADVRMQGKNLDALRERIGIGRSLLSREKALLSLSSSGVDT